MSSSGVSQSSCSCTARETAPVLQFKLGRVHITLCFLPVPLYHAMAWFPGLHGTLVISGNPPGTGALLWIVLTMALREYAYLVPQGATDPRTAVVCS